MVLIFAFIFFVLFVYGFFLACKFVWYLLCEWLNWFEKETRFRPRLSLQDQIKIQENKIKIQEEIIEKMKNATTSQELDDLTAKLSQV